MLLHTSNCNVSSFKIICDCISEEYCSQHIHPLTNLFPYVSEEKQSLRISAFKRLGLSKLLLGQLTRVLSDAKCILENPAKDKDLELLFGVLPLCVLTGRLDVLKDVIEGEIGISSSVKAEVARYIEEE